MPRQPGGCCRCKAPCVFLAEHFLTPLGSRWNAVSGSPTIEAETLKFTTANNILISNTPHPDGTGQYSLTGQVKATAAGDLARVIYDYDDASNFEFAEWKAGTGGYVRLYLKVAGSDTQLATVAYDSPLDTFLSFYVCCTGSFVTGQVGTVQVFAVSGVSEPDFGLGTGGTVTGTISFDDYAVEKVSADCALCRGGCTNCNANTAPEQYQVAISGLLNAAGCAICSTLNGTYILDRVGACTWRITFTAICGYDRIDLVQGSGQIQVSIAPTGGGAGTLIFLKVGLGNPHDCAHSGLSLPAVGFTGNCNHLSATCTVTAL